MKFPGQKKIAILGSTGSIGQQALEVIKCNKALFSACILTAQDNAGLLIEQAMEHQPQAVVIGNADHVQQVRTALASFSTKVYSGPAALKDIVASTDVDLVIPAMVGIAGLEPTINAIRHKKDIVLANKESLAVAGHIINPMARENDVDILPVDSEHSAIFQCLMGEQQNPIEKVYLTASGGPFRGMSRKQLAGVSKDQALKHPNWDMGPKVTIDSATMMNKGLEIMEAKWLFNLKAEQISVVIHPQSIIHSIVRFEDGSMKAQLGLPDMKQPIQFALGYPKRIPSDFPRFCFTDHPQLTFETVDTSVFQCLDLAYSAMERGGNIPCVMNAANEAAVSAFLNDRISFLHIPEVIEQCMEKAPYVDTPGLEEIIQCDNMAREMAEQIIKTIPRYKR